MFETQKLTYHSSAARYQTSHHNSTGFMSMLILMRSNMDWKWKQKEILSGLGIVRQLTKDLRSRAGKVLRLWKRSEEATAGHCIMISKMMDWREKLASTRGSWKSSWREKRCELESRTGGDFDFEYMGWSFGIGRIEWAQDGIKTRCFDSTTT